MTLLIVILICKVILLQIFIIRFLVPLPLFSYAQGGEKRGRGVVTAIKEIRPKIFEVSLTPESKVIGGFHLGTPQMTDDSVTTRFHFRSWQYLPKVGDEIEVPFQRRYHRFTRRSFNWAKSWKLQINERLTASEKILTVKHGGHCSLGISFA